MTPVSDHELAIRHFVYRHFVEQARPPTVAESAEAFNISENLAGDMYRRLHEGHFLFLEDGMPTIRMANPFSAVPTSFQVRAAGQTYFANCAWDMLGIPAAMGADAEIEARCADCGQLHRLALRGGRLQAMGGLVHFLLPFTSWYDDLVFT